MYQHIMVPMDGSKLAECVLPHVATIAEGCGVSKVTFVRVVAPFHLYAGDEYRIPVKERQRLEADSMNVAKNYLDQLVKQSPFDKMSTQAQVLLGNVVDELIKFAGENKVDLVVIATHGRSGPGRWVWGSVADRLLRSSLVPVLMVRPVECVANR